MTKKDLISENEALKDEIGIMKSVLEITLGAKEAKHIIDRTKMEYAVIKTNEKLETRDWY